MTHRNGLRRLVLLDYSDKGKFVAELRHMEITPHVTQNNASL